jgi:drug/metabolite transporter (DMT)-like permease
MYLGIVALRHASAAALGPYTLLRLVIGLAGGIVIFRELPDVLSMVGALVILASCVLSTHPGVLSRTVRAVRSRTRIFRMPLRLGGQVESA